MCPPSAKSRWAPRNWSASARSYWHPPNGIGLALQPQQRKSECMKEDDIGDLVDELIGKLNTDKLLRGSFSRPTLRGIRSCSPTTRWAAPRTAHVPATGPTSET